MTSPLDALARRLCHEFGSPALLQQALTHRSAGNLNNERLEFLGDAVLGLVIADALYARYPRASEGDLSRLRASLVKKPTLAGIARELELGEHLQLGSGELKSGGFRRDSILADALEAVIGAVYLDAGFEAAAGLVLQLYQPRLQSLPEAAALKDPKTRLQEYLQSRHIELPDYQVIQVSGKAHAQTFEVECYIPGLDRRSRGRGSSRRKAEQAAAAGMLTELGVETAKRAGSA
ncbi:ribonuclease III [Thiohalobacter thiocyanaticus]|uniref:Ribonuclease 3 n=1 Tax=Thiohalobacter thiocyanaticus TaxID=585455 RepID=A0A426QHF9_9GAMM|nr:ribonuclease III [Thiohalobacter thiocyanaticus]RRQ21191.1 ribonuclease III [Thiohalobacter thiocyanaticus]